MLDKLETDNLAEIHKTAIIYPGVVIGPNVYIGAYSVIGSPPEHREFYDGKETKGVVIKSGARIFEFVTIHAGTITPTIIESNAAIFNHSHIGHDCFIGRGSTVGGNVSLAGHCHLMEGANVSGKSCLVQHAVVGAYGFLGGFTYLTKHADVACRYIGLPSKFIGHNDIGLIRAGLTYEDAILKFEDEFMNLIKDRPL